MTKQPTKLDDVFVINLLYGNRDSAFTVDMKRVRNAKQAIYDLIEYVIGEDEPSDFEPTRTSTLRAGMAQTRNIQRAEQRKRAKELL